MNLLFLLSWGNDITIRPAGTFQETKELKARLNLKGIETDMIFYSSGFFTPFKLDPWIEEISEQDMISLGGNPHRRHAYFDREEIEAERPKKQMMED